MIGSGPWEDVNILRPGWYLHSMTILFTWREEGMSVRWEEPNYEAIVAGRAQQHVGVAAGGRQVRTSKVGTSTIHRDVDLFSFVSDPFGSGKGSDMVLLRGADFRVARLVLVPLDETRAGTRPRTTAEALSLYASEVGS